MLFLLEDACGRTMLPRRPPEALWEAGSAGRLSSRLWELAWQANRFTRLLSRARPAPTGKPRIEIHVRSPGKRSAPGDPAEENPGTHCASWLPWSVAPGSH